MPAHFMQALYSVMQLTFLDKFSDFTAPVTPLLEIA